MNMSKYCKNKGMNKEEYINFKNNIKTLALAIAANTQTTKGVYKNINNIIKYNTDKNIKYFLIQELKKLGFEFIEDYTLYRY